jgi:hypothetical protein
VSDAAAYAAGGHRRSDAFAKVREQYLALEPMARKFLRNVLAEGPSVYHVFRYDLTFKHERNRRECLSLAKMIDVAREHPRHNGLLLELACRRLAGVHAADQGDDWSVCDSLEGIANRQSFLPEKVMQRTVKNLLRVRSLHNVTAGRGSGRGAGAGGNSRRSDAGASSSAPSASSKGGSASSNGRKAPFGGKGGASDKV